MDFAGISTTGNQLVHAFPSFVAALVVLFASKVVFERTLPFDRRRGTRCDRNTAWGVLQGIYLVSVGIALSGVLFGKGEDSQLVAGAKVLGEGLAAVGLIRLSIWLNDRFILYGFDIAREIHQDRNMAVAFCVGGSCLAAGFNINGALTGFSANWALGMRDTVLFWLVGQATLVAGAVVFRRIKRFDVHRLIEFDDNVAVGLSFGAFLCGLGLIVRAASIGSQGSQLMSEMFRTMIIAIIGMALLVLVHLATTRFLVGVDDYVEEIEIKRNVAIAAVVGSVTIAASILVGSVIQR